MKVVAEVSKYQFFITYKKGVLASAASKPILDSSKTLHKLGYEDYSLTFESNAKSISYYLHAIFGFIKFFIKIKSNSIVATQSPIPTVSYLLKYFIPLAKLRGIKFITLIHDIDALRLPDITDAAIKKEIDLLSKYNGIIVHNDTMLQWLQSNGLSKNVKLVPLQFFDYITPPEQLSKNSGQLFNNEIAFAGHLAKSTFVYSLDVVKNWKFNIYGGGFNQDSNKNINTTWKGEFAPDDVVKHLSGSFGLVWDGADTSDINANRFGNYMKYNNPFKFSLYLAAGLPVIAPSTAAIAATIKAYNIGLLIDSLSDLDTFTISNEEYQQMKQNVLEVQKNIVAGNYLTKAVLKVEELIRD